MNKDLTVERLTLDLNSTLEHELSRVLTVERKQDSAYPHIPFSKLELISYLKNAKSLIPDIKVPSFLDVGCGIGSVCRIAGFLGFKADGLEIRPEYIETARNIVRCPSKIINEDGRNFNSYKNYDVLYFFNPMFHSDECSALVEAVIKGAKIGAVIIAIAGVRAFKHLLNKTKFDSIWIKKDN